MQATHSASKPKPAAPASRLIQRACASCGAAKQSEDEAECPSCKGKRVQRRATDASSVGPAATSGFEHGGAPLARPWRERLEQQFGSDFSAVRLHDDGSAHRAARELKAHAFTFGQHIHFAAGQYRPESKQGLHLLAHELTHTLQQQRNGSAGAALARDADGSTQIDAPDSPLEHAADAAADAVVAGRRPAAQHGSGARLQLDAEGTAKRVVDDDTTIEISRTLTPQRCEKVEDTQSTPRKDVFYWDENAQAVGLRYKSCKGRAQLSTGVELDYSDLKRAGEELLRSVGSNPQGGKAALEDAVNSATVSANGHVSYTLDQTLDVSLSGDSKAGANEQQAQVKVRLLVDTANKKVQVLAEAGAGITSSDVQRQVELFARTQLKLGPVSVEVKFSDKKTTPAGGATTDQTTTTLTGTADITQRISLGCQYSHVGPGNDNFTCGPQIKLDKVDPPAKVSCYACKCPPPRPDYTCRKVTKAHGKPVVDVKRGDETTRLLYQYDTDVPADAARFKGQVAGVAGLVGQGYQVHKILGYASPEASREYNQKLGARRAQQAYGAISAELTAQKLSATLPAPVGVGELLGDSSTRPDKEAYDSQLIAELRAKLAPLDDDFRLDLLGVDGPRRSDPEQRKQVLEDIKEFMEGKDADGKKLTQRATWEKIFPFLRRVEVLLHRDEKGHIEQVGDSNDPTACSDADKALVDSELGPIPEGKKLPQEACE